MQTKNRNKKIMDRYSDFLHRFFSFWEVPENEKIFTRGELRKWWKNAPRKIGKWEEKIGGIMKIPASVNANKISGLEIDSESISNVKARSGEDKIQRVREKLSAIYDGTWNEKKPKEKEGGGKATEVVMPENQITQSQSNIGLALNPIEKTNSEPDGKTTIEQTIIEESNGVFKVIDEPADLELVPIAEAAKSSVYSREYLSSSIRSGRLKARKIDGGWHTTEEWLQEFTEDSRVRKDKSRERLSRKLKGEEEEILKEEKKGVEVSRPPLIYWPAFSARILKPALAAMLLLLFVAAANYSKADITGARDIVLKEALVVYNRTLDGISGSGVAVNTHLAGVIHGLKVSTEKISRLGLNIFYRNKINEFENKTGLTFRGSDEGRKEAIENGAEGGIVEGEQRSKVEVRQGLGSSSQVLAATDTTPTVGDLEVSMYLLGPDAKEIANGEYEVRFSLYSLDRAESDPYPSDTDEASRVWEETQTVQVENGLLKTYLGGVNPIPSNFNFASSVYYLGIRVAQDPEMIPRKRIGAVPLARTAMNIAGQSIGNAAGNIPLSNGTINLNLNADLLDGMDSRDFQAAGTYDNYVSWKLASSATDKGQKIKSNKAAVFAGGNGILTTRNLNTLTIEPVYGSEANTVAQGSTVITVNTEGNLEGGGSGTAGGGLSLTIDTVDNPIFTTVYLSTLDLGTNTIADQNFTGNWNFNNGIVSDIDALTATTGNFTTANITTGNITTADFGTNTIADGNLTGDWNFNTGTLSNIAEATITGNFNLTASTNLIFGGATSLGEATSATDSGAYFVGVSTAGFGSSASANVQDVLADLDTAITTGSPGSMWTLAGGTIYPTNTANDLAIGGTTPAGSIFGIDESLGNFYFGYDASANPTFNFKAINNAMGEFGYNANDAFYITGANFGINEINPLYNLDVNGTLRVTGNFDAQSGIDVTGANLTVGGANFSVNVANGNVTANGDFEFTGNQSITGTGTITVNPTGNLYLQSSSYFMDESGNLTVAKVIAPEMEYSGNITIDANSAAGTTTITVVNQDGAQVANLQIEGDIDVQGGKIILATGETIDAETADKVKINSNGDIIAILGDAAGAKKFAVYDSTGASEVGHIDSNGNIQMDGTATFADKLTVESNGASITGDVVIVGDIDATTGTITTLDGTTLTYGTGNFTTLDLGTNTIYDGNLTGNWNFNAGNLTNITALTAGTVNATTIDLGTNTIYDGNLTGGWNFNSSALTGISSIDTINVSGTALTFTGTAPTISVSTAATNINLEAGTTGEINIGSVSSGNVNIASQGTGDIILAGGSASTGCTIDNATGNLDCSGNITGSSLGTIGFWTRTATNLTPATAGDDLYLPTNSLLGVGYDPATFSAGTVAAFSGNVGIGTTNPAEKMHLSGGNFLQDAYRNPTLKGSLIDATNINGPKSVYVSGKYAYVVGSESKSLAIIDVSNPSSPTMEGSLIDAINFDSPRAVFVSGKYAYIAGGAKNSFAVVDVSNPSNPILVSNLIDDTNLDYPNNVYISGRYAYVSVQHNHRLTVIDISNPSDPVVAGSITDAVNINNAHSVYVSGKYAYLTGVNSDSLAVYDISDPTNPSFAGSLIDSVNMDTPESVYVSGKYAYVASYNSDSVAVVDVSNPASPSLTGVLFDSVNLDRAYYIYVAGSYAYVSSVNSDSLSVIDVSDPAHPVLAGALIDSVNMDGGYCVYVSGKYAYVVGSNSDSLAIIDIVGIDTPAIFAGSIEAGSLRINERADIGSDLYVRNGLTVGESGIFSGGPLSVSSSRNSYFAGNLGIGSTNPNQLFTVGAINQFTVSSSGNVTAGTYNGITITSGTGTLTLNNKTLTLNNTLAFTGADSKTINFGTNNLSFSTTGDYTLTIPATGTAALGTGTNNYITRWTGINTLSTGVIYDDGTNVGIGTTDVGTYKLNVGGSVNATGYYVSGTALSPTIAGTLTGETLYWNGAAWTASTNLFNNNTNVGIGTTSPLAKLEILDASNPQLRLTQASGASYADFQVDSAGGLTIATSAGVTSQWLKMDGNYNFLFGDGAGYSNTGQFNYVFGENAGYQNAGDSNYLIGNSAGYDNNSDSEDNYFFGTSAGYENVGDMNYFIGEGAGYSNVGDNNYFFGSTAGYTNTGSNNTFIGDSAGYANSGSYNLFIGDSAGYNNTADGNLFIGDNAGWSNTSGNQNILIGYNAGWSLETGSNNIILGYNQDSPAADTTNFLNIGGAIFGNLSNGNVGIGATNPLAKLDVRGALYAGTNGTEFQVSTGGNVTAGTYNGITITSGTGTLTLNTKTLTLNNSLAFTGADSKTINFGTNNLSFSTSGDYTLTIPQTGTAALGTGTNNYITRWTGTNTLSTGTIYDNGTNVGIGTTDVGTYKLNVGGSVNATGYYVSGTPLSPTIAGTLTGETLYWNGAAWTASTNLFNNNTNVGIGTTAPGARFSIKGSNSEGTLGTEKVTNGSFTGNANGWSMFGGFSYNSNNVIHTPGSSGILSQNFSNGLYERYLMIFTIASRTAGSVRVQVGHSSPSGSFYQNGTHSINIATSFLDMGVMLLSSDDFDGTIDDVSVKKITAADTALSLINNNGSPGPEMRSGGSWLFNTFTGLYSGYSNVSGFDNTAYGYSALNSNVAGNHNTAVGSGALYANTNGSNNIAIGYAANASSITGSYNVAIGSNSIQYNQFGSANTVLGDSAGQGSYSNSSLQNDTFIGYQSGYSALTTGDNNTYLGYQSGYTGTTGANNLVLGYQAGYLNSTGSSNVFLGYKAGYSETGSNKLYIANSDTTSLIYGDFSTGAVGIGGTVAHTNPHLTILAAGNVGIGTTNPLAKLDVRGAIYAGTNGTEFQVSTGGNVTAGTYNGITITTGTGTLTLNTKTLTLNNSLSFTGADSKTINFGTNNLTFSTAGDYTLTIPATGTAALGTGTNNYITRWTGTNTLSTGTIYDNGTNVGIGTTDVGTYKLNVGGTVNATSYYVSGTPLATTTAGTYNGQTLYWNSGSSAWTASTNLFNNNTNVGIGTTLPSQLFQVNNSGSNPVVITSGGNLGIGITSPTQKLHIVGSGLFTAGIYIGSDADTNALIDDSSNGAGSTTLYIGNRAIATAGSGGTIFGTENYISKFGSGGTSIGNSQIYDNGTSVGIGTTNLSGVKFKIANDESSVSDTYDDQSKIAGASDATVSGGQVKVSETTCGTYSVQDADGNSYDTVLIGSRCWMASNLNVGDPVCTIGGNEDGDGNDDTCTKNMSDDANIEKYCYLNNAANCAAKGGLYQWDEAMQYSETVPRQGICPANWHIPTDAEWKTAEMAIGMSQEQADLTGWRGTTEGDELKDSGLCGGRTPCDTSGFNGLLAGYRFSGGSFYDLGYVENSWSSSVSGGDAWSRGLFLYEARVYRYLFDQAYGFSVRCVKD